jgi:hypothetical protein
MHIEDLVHEVRQAALFLRRNTDARDQFLKDYPDFPARNLVEFVLKSGLLLMVGWMVAGAAYALRRFKMGQRHL